MRAKFLQTTDLRAGDVLLYNSNSFIAWAIGQFDGTDVCHAGLYLGGQKVGEAKMREGVTMQPLQKSIAGCNWVAVRRYKTDDLFSVVEQANSIINRKEKYAFGQIILLAAVCSCKNLDFDSYPILKRIAKKSRILARKDLESMKSQKKEPMICSEFVYRSFCEAGYTIELDRDDIFGCSAATDNVPAGKKSVVSSATSEAASIEEVNALIRQYQEEVRAAKNKDNLVFGCRSTDDIDIEELQNDARLFLDELSAASCPLLCGGTDADSCSPINPNFVTPGDLLKSPSFIDIGKLKP